MTGQAPMQIDRWHDPFATPAQRYAVQDDDEHRALTPAEVAAEVERMERLCAFFAAQARPEAIAARAAAVRRELARVEARRTADEARYREHVELLTHPKTLARRAQSLERAIARALQCGDDDEAAALRAMLARLPATIAQDAARVSAHAARLRATNAVEVAALRDELAQTR